MGNPRPGSQPGRGSALRTETAGRVLGAAPGSGCGASSPDLALGERRGGSQGEEMQSIHWSRGCGPGSEPQARLPAGRPGGGTSDKMAQPHGAGWATRAGARRAVRACFRTSGVGNGLRARAPGRVGGAAFPEVRLPGGELGPASPWVPRGGSA